MDGMYERTAMCIGEDAVKKLQKSHVAVFGVGGVGGYTAEVLVRSGIGEITVIDNDVISCYIRIQFKQTDNRTAQYHRKKEN